MTTEVKPGLQRDPRLDSRDPGGFRIEHRINVDAPAEAIWALLGDLENWGRWNPLYPEATGVSRVGETLNAVIAIPGMKPSKFRSVISEWRPNRKLEWRVSNAGGLMRMRRYMEIEPVGAQACAFANGEIFGGPLGPAMGRLMASRVQEGFRRMSEALKEAAEARWRAR
jgi:hypothetical protein